jgi:hypothetical protein
MGSTTTFAPPPDPMATVDPSGQMIAPMAVPQYAQPGMSYAPQGAHMDPELQAASVHHGRLATALNAVGNILGGARNYNLQTNPDGTVDIQPVESTPGQKWGRIAAAALQGAATGFAAGQGPGGQARAFAAGLDRSMAATQAQQDKTLQEAQRQENQNRQRQLFNANMAMTHQQLIKATFDNQASKVRFGQEQVKFATDLKKQLNDMGATLAGDYSTPDELYAHANGNPQAIDAHVGKNGMLVPVPTYDASGNVTGGSLYIIPEDRRKQLNDIAIDIPFTTTVNNAQGKAETKTVWQHIDKGMMDWEHIIAAQQQALVQGNNATISAAQLGLQQDANQRAEELAPHTIANVDAETQAARAQAANAGTGTLQMVETPDGGSVLLNTKTGTVSAPSTSVQKIGTAAKQAAAIEKQIGPARDAMNFANSYLAMGPAHFTGAGDEALMEKYFELAKPSSGFRMTQSQQDMLKNSQDAFNSLKARAGHLAHGTWFSDQQRQQIVGAMADLARSKAAGAAAVHGGGVPQPAAPAAAPPPAVGAIVDGHQFLGGDPSNQANWKVAPQ